MSPSSIDYALSVIFGQSQTSLLYLYSIGQHYMLAQLKCINLHKVVGEMQLPESCLHIQTLYTLAVFQLCRGMKTILLLI